MDKPFGMRYNILENNLSKESLMDEHERKHLSEVIDYDRDIAPYRVLEVVSGVGSAKNYWVENVLA